MSAPLDKRSRAWVEVDLAALQSNVRAISVFVGSATDVMAIVKADAYGHGLLRVAQASLQAGCTWLGVATLEEALKLRVTGIEAPIALLAPALSTDAAEIVRNQITPMVGDRTFLDALASHRHLERTQSVEVHLDIDTGMGRSGVLPADALDLWRHAQSLGIAVTGISSHFADADGDDPEHTRMQRAEFLATRDELIAAGVQFEWIHQDNSASTLAERDSECNLVRPGLLLYGITPNTAFPSPSERSERSGEGRVRENWCAEHPTPNAQPPLPLSPVLSLYARIATVRHLPQGHGISYGVTHRLQRDSRVATVLIGYGDGYPRALSNCGHMLVHGKRSPILGRVCMDQTVIDVTDIQEAQAGDAAVCIGKQGTDQITVEEVTALTGGTEHEFTTCLTARVARVYVNE